MARALQLFENAPEISERAHSILSQYFHYASFRANQLNVITNTLNGGDSLVIMGTGSGKSLLYQIPPLILNKTSIVISPLLSLIQNQVTGLLSRGISAISFTSARIPQPDDYIDAFVQKKYSLIYMTPEGIQSKLNWIKMLYEKDGIACIAVDEAHCISEWGIDFRPKYQEINTIREICRKVPILALTATASLKVQNDIEKLLRLGRYGHRMREYISSFYRSNLFISIHNKSNMQQDMVKQQYYNNGSTIIYAPTRRSCDSIAKLLSSNAISAKSYHGGLTNSARVTVQQEFENNIIQCVVATVAFGMGIDKPDVRHVIHWGPADSLAAYYQQIGRAGRDGVDAQCILFWKQGDLSKSNWRADQTENLNYQALILKQIRGLESFLYTNGCRKKYICNFFGEQKFDDCVEGCDNCVLRYQNNMTDAINQPQDYTQQVNFMVQSCIDTGQRFGITTLVALLHGTDNKQTRQIINYKNKKTWSALSNKTLPYLRELGRKTIEFGYLGEQWMQRQGSYRIGYKRIYVTPKGYDLVNNKISVPPWIPQGAMKSKRKTISSKKRKATSSNSLKTVNDKQYKHGSSRRPLLNINNHCNAQKVPTNSPIIDLSALKVSEAILKKKLQKLRQKMATKQSVSSKRIISNEGIDWLCKEQPSTIAQLQNSSSYSITAEFIDKYGKQMLRCITEHNSTC
eukprot:115962_1